MTAALLAILTLVSTPAAEQPPLTPGTMLPTLTGTDLNGTSVSLPAAAAGRITVVAFGFSYASRYPVEAWTEHVRAKWGAHDRVMWYQVPMIGGLARLAKPFITGGMKKDTPAAERRHSMVVFGGVGDWKKRLGVTDDELAYVVVVDGSGVVRWVRAGAVSADAADDLDRNVHTLLDKESR